jgi:hypothetical protein
VISATQNFQEAMLSCNGQVESARIDLDKALSAMSESQGQGFKPPAHWTMRDVSDVASWPIKKIEWVIEDVAARGTLVWVSADSQTGKTLIGLYNALQIIKGGLLYGQFKINPVERILYLVLEDPDRRIQDRILDILHHESVGIDPGRFITYFAGGLNLGDEAQLDFLDNLMAQYDVVYLDTYQKATPGILSFDDVKQSLIIHRLWAMTRKHNTLLFVNDHFRVAAESRGKKKQEPNKSRTKGTGGKIQNADCAISMDKEGDKIRVKIESKDSGDRFFMLQVAPKSSTEEKFTWIGDLEQIRNDMAAIGQANRQKVNEAIPATGEVSASEIVDIVKTMKLRTVNNHLAALIKDSKISTNGKEGKAIRYKRAESITQEKCPSCANPANQTNLYV